MMNSNNTRSILEAILNKIDPENLYNEIDKPLDQSIQSFSFTLPDKITHKIFNGIIGKFYKHIHQSQRDLFKELTDSKALDEVLWLLENHYQSYKAQGYEGALFDTLKVYPEWIFIILEQIVEILKRTEREKYITWIICTNIDPLDWNLKVQIVKYILENYGHLLHLDITKLSPSQLIPYLEELLSILTDSVFPSSTPV